MLGIVRERFEAINNGARAQVRLFDLMGGPVRISRCPIGQANKIRILNRSPWNSRAILYKIDPYIQFFEYGCLTKTNYVIVANIGDDRLLTTVFAATGHGKLFGRFALTDDFTGAEIGPRSVSELNDRFILTVSVLAALCGGYRIVRD